MRKCEQQKKVNVAIVSRNFFGAERRFFRIIQTINNRPGEVRAALLINSSLFTAAKRVEWAENLLHALDGAGQLAVFPDRLADLGLTRRLYRFFSVLTSATPLHSVLRYELLAYARGLFGRPVVMEITAPDEADRIALRRPYYLLRGIAGFRMVSPAVNNRFLDNLTRRFGDSRASPLAARCEVTSSPFFGQRSTSTPYEDKRNVIISASRYIPRKNVVLIAKALSVALPQLPGWSAVLAGKGDDEEEIRRILAPLIADGRVQVGYESKMDERLRESKIYVSMIQPDNYPSQAIIEAMAYGNALVLSNTGQSALFINGKNGLLVNADIEALTKALLNLANDDLRLKEMSRASVEHVAKSFSAERHVAELLAMHGIGGF